MMLRVAAVEILVEAVDTVEANDSARARIVRAFEAAGASDVHVLAPEEAPRRSIRLHVRFRLEVDPPRLREQVEQVLATGELPALGGGGWRVLSLTEDAGWDRDS
jgi:hypothetical protein